ncbi:MAG: hypothetical protein GY731_18160 [Gammaproteobacteria bacterium]|nr:hypothetical protein [Gammaproteobacteria bacterium]
MGEEVLRTAHKAVLQLQDSSGTSTARLVNIAGRQRMLSQRLCNLYMLLSWGFTQAEYTNDYSQAMNEFRGALTDLQDAKENTTSISQKLKEVSRQWDMFERSARLKDGEYVPLLIAMSAEKILKKMNEATGMYAELLSAR